MSFFALVGSHSEPKRLPKTLEKFLPLEGGKVIKKASESIKNRYIEEYQEYLNKINK